jgi:hypothetical protein
MEFEIWAGFGLAGSNEILPEYSTLEGVFSCFHGQK